MQVLKNTIWAGLTSCRVYVYNQGFFPASTCLCHFKPCLPISMMYFVKLCLGLCIKLGVQFEKEFIVLALVMEIAGLLHFSD